MVELSIRESPSQMDGCNSLVATAMCCDYNIRQFESFQPATVLAVVPCGATKTPIKWRGKDHHNTSTLTAASKGNSLETEQKAQ